MKVAGRVALLALLLVAGCGREGIPEAKRESFVKILNMAREVRSTTASETERMNAKLQAFQYQAAAAKKLNFGAAPDKGAEEQANAMASEWKKTLAEVDAFLVELDRGIGDLQTSIELDAPIACEDAVQRIVDTMNTHKITFKPPPDVPPSPHP
jgi:phage protein D